MANKIDGVHLVLDGISDAPNECFTEANIHAMIAELARALNMQIIMGPVSQEVEVDPSKLTGDVFVDEGGISTICMISTSHISFHTWPLRGVFMADIFSCKSFDVSAAHAITMKFLRSSSKLCTAQVLRRNPLEARAPKS